MYINGATYNDSGKKAFRAAEALEACRRVKVNNNGEIEYADADDAGIGVTADSCPVGEEVTVAMWSKPGTIPIAGSAALGKGVALYAAADGKVQPLPAGAGTYLHVGINVGNYATNADGGVAEIMPVNVGRSVVVAP